MKTTPHNLAKIPTGCRGNGSDPSRDMKEGGSASLEQVLRGFYDEPVSDDDAAVMAARLTDFVGLLLEVEEQNRIDA